MEEGNVAWRRGEAKPREAPPASRPAHLKRPSIGSRSRRNVTPHDDRRAVGELGEAARRDLFPLADAFGDLDPAVAQIDTECDLALAGDVVLDQEELGHSRERGERGARDGDRAVVLAD